MFFWQGILSFWICQNVLLHFSLLKFHDCFIGSIELAHQRNECLYVLVRCNKQCYGLTDIFVEVRSIARGIMKKLPSLWFISIPCLVENVIGCRKLTAKISSVVQTGRNLNIVLVTSATSSVASWPLSASLGSVIKLIFDFGSLLF